VHKTGIFTYLYCASIVAIITLLPVRLEAIDSTFCIQSQYQYKDHTVGDHWTGSAVRIFHGVYVIISDSSGHITWAGYTNNTGPNPGCTPTIHPPSGSVRVTVYSFGKPTQNHTLYSHKNYGQYYSYVSTEQSFIASTGMYIVSPPMTIRQFASYAAAAETLRVTPDIILGTESITIKVESELDNNCRTISNGDIILNPYCYNERYSISHEIGHSYQKKATDALNALTDYSTFQCFANCPASCTSGTASTCSHKLTSKEYMTAAMTEGFANYTAASTWTIGPACKIANHTGNLSLYSEIDCSGAGSFPNKYLKNVCESCVSTTDPACNLWGVELDWLKAFWASNHGSCADDGTVMDWLVWMSHLPIEGIDECNIYQILTPLVYNICWPGAAANFGINFINTGCTIESTCN